MLQSAVEATPQESRRRYAVGQAALTLPPKRAPTLLLQGVARTVAAGGTIYAQANPADFIYQVTSGMVRTITVRRDGRSSRQFHRHSCRRRPDVDLFRKEISLPALPCR